MILFILILSGVLLALGATVDWMYKRRGITDLNPEENAKHVSESERVYIESHMHNIKNDHSNGLF
ncbi:hypothetical protein [Neobacillus sp. LXY-4]|uniref:hypothetical protein n=1 Tax=Neobacillus sp. LXY-4 TaxID=3379826 RepID=UPI003EE04425